MSRAKDVIQPWMEEVWPAAQAVWRAADRPARAHAMNARVGDSTAYRTFLDAWGGLNTRLLRATLTLWWWSVGGDPDTWPTPDQVRERWEATS